MQLDASKLYSVALEQCMILQQQVIELRALYNQVNEELEKLKVEKQLKVEEQLKAEEQEEC